MRIGIISHTLINTKQLTMILKLAKEFDSRENFSIKQLPVHLIKLGSDSKKFQQTDANEIDRSVISETIDSLIQQVDDSLSSDNSNNNDMKAQEHGDTEAESELEEEVVQLIETMTSKVDQIQEVHRAESELTNTSLLIVETSKQDEEEEDEEEDEVYVQNDQGKDNPQVDDDDDEQVAVIQKSLETEDDALNLSTNTTSECTKAREDEKQENSTTTTTTTSSSRRNSSSSLICTKSTIDEEKDVEKIDNTNTTNSFTTTTTTTTTTGPTNKINSTIAEETEEAESTHKVVGGETNNNKDEELVVFDDNEGEEEHEETEELTIDQENLEKTEAFCGDNSHKNNHTNSKSELQENTLTPSATTTSVSHHNNTATDFQRDTAISSSTPSTTIIDEELDSIVKSNDLAAGLLLSDESGDLSINKLSAIERIDKTSENSISTTLSLNDSISSDTHSSEIHQDQDDSLMTSSDLDATNASSNGTVKKIILKNKVIRKTDHSTYSQNFCEIFNIPLELS